MSRNSGPGRPAPKHDLAIARAIWVVIGLAVGFALALFAGSNGWWWLSLGLVIGLLLAYFRTRPQQQIEED